MPIDSEAPAETQKRVRIADEFAKPIMPLAQGIMLGGSMGFGQNYSITRDSDIDCVIVIDSSALPELVKLPFFSIIPPSARKLFADEHISFIHTSERVDQVEVNAFVYEAKQYADFCLALGDLTGFAPRHPSRSQKAWNFEGKQISFDRNVRQISGGFLYDKPALVDGKYWGGVPRQDFFYSGKVLQQKDGFFRELGNRVWQKTIELLVKEHGPKIDLRNANVLNTHFTYQKEPGRLPHSVITRINERTFTELKAYLQTK